MSGLDLRDYQLKAIAGMHNGCILCGGVGSGKSRTSLAYYYRQCGGKLYSDDVPCPPNPIDLYIITTARKRDTFEWEDEMAIFRLSSWPVNIIVDSWNNIQKYEKVGNSFFIFDEQRLVGSGPWVKAFYRIAKRNKWILLSATPGDSWTDYIPVFVANGFYKNKTAFLTEHAVYSHYCNFPKIDKFVGQRKLNICKEMLLVTMDFDRKALHTVLFVPTLYDISTYKNVRKTRWNIYKDQPIVNAAELCYTLRKVVNSHPDRIEKCLNIQKTHKKVIIFYNFDYELEILKNAQWGDLVKVAEWNGHRHQPIPWGDEWAYFVQYTSGCEGWNCILTDTIIFYSQNYSYKVMTQAAGRTDRLNTPFKELFYYHLTSTSSIDLAIKKALSEKREFNIRKFVGG